MLLQWLGLLIVMCAIVYTNTYFNIKIVVDNYSFAILWVLLFIVMLFLIILQSQYFHKESYNPFVQFCFWLLSLIIITILYVTYIQAFIDIESAPDYLWHNDYFKINVEYTLKYKIYFLREYLHIIYPKRAQIYIDVGSILFNQERFMGLLEYLDMGEVIKQNSTLEDIKYSAEMFIQEYILYRLQQATFLVCMAEELLWRESFLYNFLLFLRNSALILAFPMVVSKLLLFPFSPGVLFFNYVKWHKLLNEIINKRFRDMVFDKAYEIITHFFVNYDFYIEGHLLQGVEREDLLKLLAVLLIKHYGSKKILEMVDELHKTL